MSEDVNIANFIKISLKFAIVFLFVVEFFVIF